MLFLSSHGCAFDSGANALVSTTAAQVASQCIFDLNVGGFGRAFQQRAGRHDHAVDAVTALHGLLINKSLLQLAGLAVLAQAFQRGDGFACQSADRQQTRAGGHIVDMNCTGTALTQAAAVLGTFKFQVVAQNIEQRRVCVGDYSLRFSIDFKFLAWHGLSLLDYVN